MAVRIRLTRLGKKKQPAYRVVVADSHGASTALESAPFAVADDTTPPVLDGLVARRAGSLEPSSSFTIGESLLIEGAISTTTPQGMEATYAELRVPRFRRSFTLSRELDPGRIEANLTDGVLKLRIPKHAEAQPRRIAVQVT